MNENDNHPLTNGTYNWSDDPNNPLFDADCEPVNYHQFTVETPEPNEYLSEQIEALHQLCISGESDAPWATWEECFSYDLEAVLGVRLQTLCHNRRRLNQHGD